MQIVLQQLVEAENIGNQRLTTSTDNFDPCHYFGCAHETRQSIDDYLVTTREGWR